FEAARGKFHASASASIARRLLDRFVRAPAVANRQHPRKICAARHCPGWVITPRLPRKNGGTSGMPRTALLLLVVYLALGFGLRSWLQWRYTGSTGFRGISGAPGSAEWWGGVLFIAALLALL